MTSAECQQLIRNLQVVIDDTQNILERFEVTGMDEQMPGDYDKLLGILDGAVTQQRAHTLAFLDA